MRVIVFYDIYYEYYFTIILLANILYNDVRVIVFNYINFKLI